MKVILSSVSKGENGENLPPTTLSYESGAVTLAAVETASRPTVLALLATGRMVPDAGTLAVRFADAAAAVAAAAAAAAAVDAVDAVDVDANVNDGADFAPAPDVDVDVDDDDEVDSAPAHGVDSGADDTEPMIGVQATGDSPATGRADTTARAATATAATTATAAATATATATANAATTAATTATPATATTAATAADLARLRSVTAIVDAPDVSEPVADLRLASVVQEELMFAGRPSTRRATAAALDVLGAGDHARWELRNVPVAMRLHLLAELAASRPDVEALVLTSPDRHGGDPRDWWAIAADFARRGYAVLVIANQASVDDLRSESAEFEAARQRELRRRTADQQTAPSPAPGADTDSTPKDNA